MCGMNRPPYQPFPQQQYQPYQPYGKPSIQNNLGFQMPQVQKVHTSSLPFDICFNHRKVLKALAMAKMLRRKQLTIDRITSCG